jgi:hypothetical protein
MSCVILVRNEHLGARFRAVFSLHSKVNFYIVSDGMIAFGSVVNFDKYYCG